MAGLDLIIDVCLVNVAAVAGVCWKAAVSIRYSSNRPLMHCRKLRAEFESLETCYRFYVSKSCCKVGRTGIGFL